MKTRHCRPVRRLIARLAALSAAAVFIPVVAATPASASVLWDGNASKGFGVFHSTLCDGGTVSVTNWGDSHGDIFSFLKPVGVPRCEGHSLNNESLVKNNTTMWFGWDLNTKYGDADTVFQWKSNGTNDQNQQNYPVLIKVEDSKLKVFYIAPGEVWTSIGTVNWTPGTWNSIQLGITASSSTNGRLEAYVNGTKIADKSGVRTWDDLGNKPRWGTYGYDFTDAESHVWVDDPVMGTSLADVS